MIDLSDILCLENFLPHFGCSDIFFQDCCSRYWIVVNEGFILSLHQRVLMGSEANGLLPREFWKKKYGLVA
jgi:hypothetical protein